ncbi:Pr6Pr family membrane protein [Microbacteriaceae bacterium 4G12]
MPVVSAPTVRDGRAAAGTTPVSVVRLGLALLILASVLATFLDTAGHTAINPFNFFGYFTLQSNLLMAAVWIWVGMAGLSGRRVPRIADYVRASTTTYVALVGLVYATLLAPLGVAGGVPVPWANVVLHVVIPIAAVLDWIFVADRDVLDWRVLPVVLSYPVVWLAVVIIRGATDGWVPYPFLDPDRGYGAVAVTVIAITVVTVMAGAAVFALSRLSLPGGRTAPRAT